MSTDNFEAAIDSLLVNSEEPEAEAEESTLDEGDDAEETEVDAEAAETDADEETAEDAEADDDEADDADDEDGEADEGDGQEEPKSFKVKVDGEEIEVTLNDLTRSYAGQKHIQQGMQQAAAARKEAEALYHNLQAAQQQVLEFANRLQTEGVRPVPQAPDIAMMDSDPIGYMQDKAKYDVQVAEYQAQQKQIQAMSAQQAEMQKLAYTEFVKQQAQELAKAIPDFGDAQKAQQLKARIVKTGQNEYGLSEAELGQIADSRYVRVLYDAMRWNELQASKAAAKKAPEAPRNVKPKAKRPVPKNVERSRNLEKARKSGKPEAFVDLLLKKL